MEPNVSYRDTHFHRAMEIIRVQNGEVVCSSGNSSRTITNKDILIVNSGVMHKLVSNTVSTVTYIQINIDKYINPFCQESTVASGIYSFIFFNTILSEEIGFCHPVTIHFCLNSSL